ncbi:hypothetical protein AKJ16_DCAP24883 [Drosera capensis]
MQTKVDPAKDVIYVKGKRLPRKFPPKVYLALKKPKRGSDQRLDYSSMTLYWSPFFECFFFELDFLVNPSTIADAHALLERKNPSLIFLLLYLLVRVYRFPMSWPDGLAPGSCAIIVGLGGCHPTYFKAQQRMLLPNQRSIHIVCNCCSISAKHLFGLDQDFNCFAAQFFFLIECFIDILNGHALHDMLISYKLKQVSVDIDDIKMPFIIPWLRHKMGGLVHSDFNSVATIHKMSSFLTCISVFELSFLRRWVSNN